MHRVWHGKARMGTFGRLGRRSGLQHGEVADERRLLGGFLRRARLVVRPLLRRALRILPRRLCDLFAADATHRMAFSAPQCHANTGMLAQL